MRLRIEQARPTSLDMALQHAMELEAFNKAEKKHLEGEGYMRQTNQEIPRQKLEESDELKSLKETMKSMQKTLESLSSKGDLGNKTEKGNLSSTDRALIHNTSSFSRIEVGNVGTVNQSLILSAAVQNRIQKRQHLKGLANRQTKCQV